MHLRNAAQELPPSQDMRANQLHFKWIVFIVGRSTTIACCCERYIITISRTAASVRAAIAFTAFQNKPNKHTNTTGRSQHGVWVEQNVLIIISRGLRSSLTLSTGQVNLKQKPLNRCGASFLWRFCISKKTGILASILSTETRRWV